MPGTRGKSHGRGRPCYIHMTDQSTYKPQGALLQSDGSVVWRVWAPRSKNVSLVTWPNERRAETEMAAEEFGFFSHRQSDVQEGLRYAYRLDDGREYPDPASRFQPDGVHRPSAVWFANDYSWSDGDWRGVPREELIVYELHVGTFTPEGTFAAIVPRLDELAELGVTAIELMPVAQFPGERNWGYDGVHPFAVQNSYGGPRELQRLIDAAHRAGLAVLIDVVYNHFGPEGHYLGLFGPYETDRYRTPWGKAVNFDGPDSDLVRRFVIDNAVSWVRDFHADGLRLDAVHAIFDFSARHILAELQSEAQTEADRLGRTVHVIAESDLNDVRLVLPANRGGHGLDGAWSDDFHHAVHALLTGERDGYYRDFGRPEQLAKAYNDVFVYVGRYSPFRRRRHGNRVGKTDRTRFVVSVQNHDQVGNRALGERLNALLPPAAQRLACGLLMVSPCVPLLWMGEEYGETRPFPFFSSFGDPDLIEAVRRGRREEFAALEFRWDEEIPDPQSPDTFESAKLRWDWSSPAASARRRLYADLLKARRERPALRDRRHTTAQCVAAAGMAVPRAIQADVPSAAKQNDALLIIERGIETTLVVIANLTAATQSIPPIKRDGRVLLLSTESKRYGGQRNANQPPDDLLPYEMLIFGSKGQ
ncbi:MAG: malto-oligosyltrehalose trehalohydrolase [Pirellulales bacterium]|nr:malto-oligosyltrehalose trehalohydrolase [Pirellulales bacterium]